MFGLQPTHLLIIAIIAVLFFAPSRLPDLARAMRKTMQEFRAAAQEPVKSTPSASSDAREQESTAGQK